MDNLWAPWRMEYIHDNRFKTGDAPCIFCELKSGEPNPKNLVLTRGKNSYVVMNRFPYNTGHLLIIPNAHTADMKQLDGETHKEMMTLMAQGIQILTEGVGAHGFNCGLNLGRASGGGILDHLHWHIVPRWTGDTNFMPIFGQAKTMPEYLEETYQKLAKHF